jgi:hypothetical protein
MRSAPLVRVHEGAKVMERIARRERSASAPMVRVRAKRSGSPKTFLFFFKN